MLSPINSADSKTPTVHENELLALKCLLWKHPSWATCAGRGVVPCSKPLCGFVPCLSGEVMHW